MNVSMVEKYFSRVPVNFASEAILDFQKPPFWLHISTEYYARFSYKTSKDSFLVVVVRKLGWHLLFLLCIRVQRSTSCVCVCVAFILSRGKEIPILLKIKKKKRERKKENTPAGCSSSAALIPFVCCLLMSHFHRQHSLSLVLPNVVLSRFLPFLILKRRQVDLFYFVGHKQANIDLYTPRSPSIYLL